LDAHYAVTLTGCSIVIAKCCSR